jgi:alcohol dehydrogenase
MGTHTFTFNQMDEAYDVFRNASAHSALKVIISAA